MSMRGMFLPDNKEACIRNLAYLAGTFVALAGVSSGCVLYIEPLNVRLVSLCRWLFNLIELRVGRFRSIDSLDKPATVTSRCLLYLASFAFGNLLYTRRASSSRARARVCVCVCVCVCFVAAVFTSSCCVARPFLVRG